MCSITAQYYGTIAIFKNLTDVDMGTYEGSTISSTETLQIVGKSTNKNVPVDWVVIGFSEGEAGSYTPRSMYLNTNDISYQIYDSVASGNILKAKTDATSLDDLITIYIGGQTKRFTANTTYEVEIPGSQTAVNGTYDDSLVTVTLWGYLDLSGTGPHSPLVFSDLGNLYELDSQTITVSTDVDSRLSISVIERNGAFVFTTVPYSMDFGIMAPNETLLADVIIEATTAYSIDVESQHGGRLKHSTVDEYVNYTFTFNSSTITLTQGSSTNLVSNASKSSNPGDRYPVDITLASTIGSILSGDYTDNLTFTITAN